MNVSVLVPAHNEEKGIGPLLESLLAQHTDVARLIEIVVIASGCTDRTSEIARRFSQGRPGVHVHVQERRSGKVAAINAYLQCRDPRAEMLVCCSADLRVAPDVIDRMAACLLQQPHVGMVGSRPIPDNTEEKWIGKMVQTLWELHHRVALQNPKMGELVAFRSALIDRVNELSIVDEASVEDIVRSKGYGLAYLADAVVYNHGPETLGEYFEQRRRIARGHYWLDFAFGYRVSTLHTKPVVHAAHSLFREGDSAKKCALAAAIAAEVAARAVGFWDARVTGAGRRIWSPLPTTKKGQKEFSIAAKVST